jgi:hypothetical protein
MGKHIKTKYITLGYNISKSFHQLFQLFWGEGGLQTPENVV